MKKDNLRQIPKRNYFILGVVIIATFLILYYLYMWYDAYKETKLNMRILDNYMEVINYNELDNFLIESPNSIIYVSVLEDETIREFEKKLKKEFKNNKIDKQVLYMDITNDIRDINIKNDMISKYNLNGNNITNVPLFMVIINGKIKMFYSIHDNNYDISSAVNFINNVAEDSLDDTYG